MKKTLFTAFLIIIALALVTCEGRFVDPGREEYHDGGGTGGGGGGGGGAGSTSGRLTIEDIPAKYNGKWIIAPGITLSDGTLLTAAESLTTKVTGAKISNGKVELKVWKVSEDSKLVNFNGSGTASMLTVAVMNQASISTEDIGSYSSILMPSWMHASGVFTSVKFNSGVGKAGKNELMMWADPSSL
ncbi:MAG: hypothetical protein LBH44_13145 [Treponema sp.]|jgi:hypothetical protein|nr:hypothetical protein [Treponema sp.]